MKSFFRWTSLAIAISSALLAACSPSGNPLLGLEDIPGGFEGPTIIAVSSDSATISFDSGVPTVCNAAFGVTTAYGQVATIPMLSGATLDHELTFVDLEPGTTYHYRITATDIEGNVYQSEDFTFATEADQAGDKRTNWLALDMGGVVAGSSSNFGKASNDGPWGANNAIDGSARTAWSSNGDGDDAFLVVGLAKPVHIDTLEVHTRTMPNDTAQIFSFTVTDDQGQTYGPFELPDAAQPYSFAVDFVTSVMRFDVVESNGGNTGFVELAAYGSPASDE